MLPFLWLTTSPWRFVFLTLQQSLIIYSNYISLHVTLAFRLYMTYQLRYPQYMRKLLIKSTYFSSTHPSLMLDWQAPLLWSRIIPSSSTSHTYIYTWPSPLHLPAHKTFFRKCFPSPSHSPHLHLHVSCFSNSCNPSTSIPMTFLHLHITLELHLPHNLLSKVSFIHEWITTFPYIHRPALWSQNHSIGSCSRQHFRFRPPPHISLQYFHSPSPHLHLDTSCFSLPWSPCHQLFQCHFPSHHLGLSSFTHT